MALVSLCNLDMCGYLTCYTLCCATRGDIGSCKRKKKPLVALIFGIVFYKIQ